jgi:Uma2 family endonuclease
MTIATKLMTADELLRLPDDGFMYELVRGELKKMSPAGWKHGSIGNRIAIPLGGYVRQHRLGEVPNSDTGYILAQNPDTVRQPDASFVRAERIVNTDHFFPGAPDLAVEIMSPNDTYAEVTAKKDDYLRTGTQAVVIVDPRRKTIEIHRPTGVTKAEDVLAVDDVVPGWQLPLSEIFD